MNDDTQSPYLKELHQEPSNVKVVLIVAYNIHGVTLCHAIPQD
jgi:hypothetical protein